MAQKKRNRQQLRAEQAAQARRAAETARLRRVRNRRLVIGAAGVAAVAVVAVVALLLTRGDDGTNLATSASTTPSSSPSTTPGSASTVGAKGSAAGKACVPVAGAPPQGAPTVPVKLGPPPATLVTEDLKPGAGAVVTAGQTLTVNYIGVSCSTGKIFDSSYSTNKPATFSLSGVIPGWQKGIPGMKVGGQRLLGIPPDQGYGDRGSPPDIAPGETLWFVVEVLDAKSG